MIRGPFKRVWSECLAIAALLTATPAHADQTSIPASADTSIYSENTDLSNGAGEHLFAGRTQQPDLWARRGLIKFDIAAAIPAGSTINSATLRLYKSRGRSQMDDIPIHVVTSDWGEGASDALGGEGGGIDAEAGDATWTATFYNPAGGSSEWTTPGGDFDPVPSATANAGEPGVEFYMEWTGATVAADVQIWLDDPTTNFGWILIGNETRSGTAVRWDSRTNQDPTRRPELVVDFTPPSSTGACNLPDGSCIVDTFGNCDAAGGEYLGDGSMCPEPTGACCLPDGSCVIDTQGNCIAAAGIYQGNGTDCESADCTVPLEPYVDALNIMPFAQPTSGQLGGVATYDIPIVETFQKLHRDLPPTRLWTYDGIYPGPTFLAREGREVTVNWTNEIRDDNGDYRTDHIFDVDLCPHGAEDNAKQIIHLHGGHVPEDMDGYPEDTFLPGSGKTDIWPMNQQSALLWYHDHSLGQTRLNVYAGLAGAFVVRDNAESALRLPAAQYEVPLIIQDRSFNSDGSLYYPSAWTHQFFGDYNLVNGVVTPFFNVNRATYRFRVLNGANSRTYRLSLSSGDPITLIGTDGGLLENPIQVQEITLASAERADILIDFSNLAPGAEIELLNDAPAPFPGAPGVGVLPEVMKFIVGPNAGPSYTPPPVLDAHTYPQEGTEALTRDFTMMQGPDDCTGAIWTINGLHWDHITERPILGSTEIWRFINPTGMVHPMHMHLVFFKVLDKVPFEMVDGKPVASGPPIPLSPTEQGWKDTVQVNPGEMVRVIATFEDYTGLFAYHCHILEHEDQEMMRQFEVITCGPDLADPLGVLSPADTTEAIDAVEAGDLVLDLATPMGSTDFFDMLEYLRQYDSGCDSTLEPGELFRGSSHTGGHGKKPAGSMEGNMNSHGGMMPTHSP